MENIENDFLLLKNKFIDLYLNNIGLKINIPLCMIGKLTTKNGVGIIKNVDSNSGVILIELQNTDLEITWSTLTDIIEEYGIYKLSK